jgi:long-chain acyl-CoA synthetase
VIPEPTAATGVPARVAARLSRIVEQGLARVDLTPSQYRVLMFLADGTSQASVMADHLAVSRPSVTAVVDGLVARGLVDRRHDDRDRRRVGHTITAEGLSLLAQADASLNQTLEEVLEYSPSPASRRTALDGLAAWAEALDGYRAARKARHSPQPAVGRDPLEAAG